MERTLNLPALRAALGPPEPGELPEPEQLMRLIADIEIGAIRNRFEIPDQVLRTAWYLHGVCALTESAQLYTPDRRRHAFAVSAHIFDLALADQERAAPERLSLAFGAQIGYRHAEQDPNATAVFRRVADLCHGPDPLGRVESTALSVADYVDTLALEAGVAFLGFQPGSLRILVRHWQRQLRNLARRLDQQDLRGTLFGPAQYVINAVGDMANYLTFGDRSLLDRARDALRQVLSQEVGTGDLNARWVAAHLLDLLDDMAAASLHDLLPPGTPRAVAQAFTLTSPPVLTLWPPQRDLLTRGAANPLDPATGRLLVSVPTSAGKSLISQLIMCAHLATVPGRVIYVSPLRSLTREMRRALRDRLRVLDRELGSDTPDFPVWWIDQRQATDDEADIEVVTPEHLMHTLRNDPDGALDDVTLIVIDEAHHIAQEQRGFLLEGLLAFCQTHPSAPRLVLLSAAVGNGAALAQWLDPGEPEVLFSSSWRGPRRLHGLLTTNPLWSQKRTVPRQSADRPFTTTVPLTVHVSIRPARAAAITKLTTSEEEPLGNLVFAQRHPEDWSKKDTGKSTAAYKMFAAASALFLPAGSMLMVTGTRVEAQRTAAAMAATLPDYAPAANLAAQFAEQLGEQHPLVHCTRRGVAFHHAALPTDVLEAIEDALRHELILAVVSTSTLTDGVNLPVRTVVVTAAVDDGINSAPTGVPGLNAARLLNAVGRAGRAGRESEGWILLALNRRIGEADYDLFNPEADKLQVKSALLADEALHALARAEELIAQRADGIFTIAADLAADFISFVWFVLNAHQHLAPETSGGLRPVERLLAMDQLPTDQKTRWLRLAAHVQSRFDNTDQAARRRWTAPGTSLGSARTLDAIAEQVARRLLRDDPPQTADLWDVIDPRIFALDETIRILDEEAAFDALLELPERRDAWTFYDRRQGRNRQPIAVSLREAISAWVAGEPVPSLAAAWLPGLSVDWALEQTVSNISTTFEHYLSWTLGALVNMVNNRLTTSASPVRLRPDTAWYLRYGVDTDQAAHLLTSGVHSRTLAHAIGRHAAASGIESAGLRNWLADQHITAWRHNYHPTTLGIDDLIEYVRVRRRSLLRALLTEGHLTIQVRRTGGQLPPWPTPVLLESAGADTVEEIEVRTNSDVVVAHVAAGDHADVTAILDSGIPLSTALSEDQLTISRSNAQE